jgi:phosphoglycerate dehydrogenase-like enzyme
MNTAACIVSVTHRGVIDERAVIEALKRGAIAGAGLDSTDVEPTAEDGPPWNLPNLILTPHRAGTAQHRPRKVFKYFCENLERHLQRKTLCNLVDKRHGS